MTIWYSTEDSKIAPPDEMVLTLWDGVNNKTGKPSRYYVVAAFDDGEWKDEDGNIVDPPTHWTWLPAPPKSDGQSQDSK